MHAIEILGFEKLYRTGFWRHREKVALRPFSLTVEEGEVFGCLGPNGAGKTTTLKLLMGLTRPSAGSARILGFDYRDPRVKAQIGFLPEQPYFYDYLTASELLLYYARLSGLRDPAPQVAAMLKRLSLEDAAHRQLRKFSKGMLQRVGIAQAILHDPRVVFLDEPMSGLDPIGRREVRDLILELKDAGKTVFFSTHILSDAEALCDRVAVLHHGELRGVKVVRDLIRQAEGRVEIIWEGEQALAAIRELTGDTRAAAHAGGSLRATLSENQLDAAIDHLRFHQARLISVTPVRGSVEDFFAASLGASAEAAQ